MFKSNKTVLHRVVYVIVILIIATAVNMYRQKLGSNLFEERLIAATDRKLSCTGECNIDLAALFADYEWDTVSIFIAGDVKQIQNELHLDNDISDGIVFSKEGEPVIVEMSTYDFLNDESPKVSYYVERNSGEDQYFVTKPRNQALAHVEKYMTHENDYKYLLYFR